MRTRRLIASALASVLLSGCYTLQPVGGVAQELGKQMAFDVNDAGRLALGGSMGPEIDQIEGRLVQRDSSQFVISVSSVRLLRGGDQPWAGEPVHIKSEYVSRYYERQFSLGRTLALSAVGVVAIVALVKSPIVSSGTTELPGSPSDSNKTQRSPGGPRLPDRSSPPVHLPPQFLPHLGQP
jgi:hypothetical protein